MKNLSLSVIRDLAWAAAGVLSALTLMAPGIALAGTPQLVSARITGPSTVVLTFTESVNTTLNDFSAFTGALSGQSIIGLSGSGTNIITLGFSGTPFNASATGGLTIASSLKSVADAQSIGSGPITITDGQPPILASITVSSNDAGGTVAKAGDTISVSFTANEPLMSPKITIDGHTINGSGNGQGPYTASYTISAGDAQDIIPISLAFSDGAGNQGHGAFTLGQGGGTSITSITSNATTPGALRAGDTITFVATLANPVPGAVINGSYDGVPLSWSSQNNGSTYTATFTVGTGVASTYAPLQITGVTVTDTSGNVSAPASGYDVQKTVNAQSFQITQSVAIPSISTTNAPVYQFYSAQDGTITYGGDCTSPVLSAVAGINAIHFNALPDGVHSNCTIKVTNQAGYASNILQIPTFTVSTGGSTAGSGTTSGSTSGTTSGSGTVTAYQFTKALDIGSTGTDVTALQLLLTAEGYYSGSVTGYYGSETQAAVKKFQAAHGIAQLGNVGPSTRAALNGGATTSSGASSGTSSVGDGYKFNKPLDVGSTGTDVTELQKRLTAEGYYSGPVNGNYGPLTEAAVKKYQGAHGLTQLGNVGPGTRASLNAGN